MSPHASRVSRLARPLVAGLALVAVALPARATEDATYRALRDARPDGRTLTLTAPAVLERDAFRFHLDSGEVHLFAPVAGREVGAVFRGRGRFRLAPENERERHHLGLVTGKPRLEVLEAPFDELVLLFTDATGDELTALGAVGPAAAPAPAAEAAWKTAREWQRGRFATNLQARLLADLHEDVPPAAGVFLALFAGGDVPPAVAVVDPRGVGATRLYPQAGRERTALFVGDEHRGGLWYAGDDAPALASHLDAVHYAIDTTVDPKLRLSGTTTVRFRAAAPTRVVPVQLLPTLRLATAEARRAGEATWRPAAFVQEGAKEDADVVVVLPETLPAGAEGELRLAYAGDEVIADREDTYAVAARTSWYPNLGVFTDPATFDLTYRVPPGYEVVSVGEEVERRDEDGAAVSVWRATSPLRVAGFNYGRFESKTRDDDASGLEVSVHSSAKVGHIPDGAWGGGAFEGLEGTTFDVESGMTAILINQQRPRGGRVKASELAEWALADAVNAGRVATKYFGPLPTPRVAVTQQAQWFFGQSWPSLVFLPYLSFLDGTQRQTLGLGGTQDFVDRVGYHEMAHQWWGHLVGWESYRDQWLSEGFAEFTAALTLQHAAGWPSYDRFWANAREWIVDAGAHGAMPPYQAGPIVQGYRLSTQATPHANDALVYAKGGYVLHMLRMAMWDPKSPEPDAAFIALMRDFVAKHAGGLATTEDFEAAVERHMIPALNATGDGQIDWFFDQWVHGREVPRLTSRLAVEKAGKDRYRITGEVVFADVSDGFRAMVPLYLDFGDGQMARIGGIPFVGPGTRPVNVELDLPKKPKAALVNAHGEVLTRD